MKRLTEVAGGYVRNLKYSCVSMCLMHCVTYKDCQMSVNSQTDNQWTGLKHRHLHVWYQCLSSTSQTIRKSLSPSHRYVASRIHSFHIEHTAILYTNYPLRFEMLHLLMRKLRMKNPHLDELNSIFRSLGNIHSPQPSR